MKKYFILILLIMFTVTNAFAQEIAWEKQNNSIYDDSNYVKIRQDGNNVKVKVTKKQHNQLQFSDNISDEKSVRQNTNGYSDVLTVQNAQNRNLNPNYTKMINTAGGAVLGLSYLTALTYVLIVDPYAVKINGQKYYMVRNNESNQYTVNDILGYDDTKADIFDDMKNLNTDNDSSKITGEELKKAGIRFVAIVNDKLQLYDKTLDYNLDNVQYIDLTTLRGTINNGKIGSFGYFDMYIRENNKNKKIIGFVTFDSDETLNEMITQ